MKAQNFTLVFLPPAADLTETRADAPSHRLPTTHLLPALRLSGSLQINSVTRLKKKEKMAPVHIDHLGDERGSDRAGWAAPDGLDIVLSMSSRPARRRRPNLLSGARLNL